MATVAVESRAEVRRIAGDENRDDPGGGAVVQSRVDVTTITRI
jgi:hypothetical protein